LFADDLESLIENLTGVLIGARLDSQIDHALLFGFQVNRHGLVPFSIANCSVLLGVANVNTAVSTVFSPPLCG
jgi:hypothetical protein